ncbi:MAG TPA: SMP-30/gluconolactonase/LRE family protein [Puia sp.]|nr:SMP-30/gluconolactonase/LRE family protein [Puia sp.]
MSKFIAGFFFGCVLLLCSCGQHRPEATTVGQDSLGRIELYTAGANKIIDSQARIEIIGRHYLWSEGPVWVQKKQMLLFSDVRANAIFKWNMHDTPVVYLTPSGYTDPRPRNGENGSNGLALDRSGHLLMCQSGNRQVARMNASIDSPKPSFTILAPDYNGKKFNSPNDLVVDSRGEIFFTDPIYGLPGGAEDPSRELDFEGVFKISTNGQVRLLIDSIHRPNGIALSTDEKTLYLGSTDGMHSGWYAYQLDSNRNIISGGMLLDASSLMARATIKQGGDGMKIDKYGNLFASGPDGINIISPSGTLLGLIRIYRHPVSNCAFDQAKDVLFVTSDDRVLKINLH